MSGKLPALNSALEGLACQPLRGRLLTLSGDRTSCLSSLFLKGRGHHLSLVSGTCRPQPLLNIPP